jgi:hypothetical protein
VVPIPAVDPGEGYNVTVGNALRRYSEGGFLIVGVIPAGPGPGQIVLQKPRFDQ